MIDLFLNTSYVVPKYSSNFLPKAVTNSDLVFGSILPPNAENMLPHSNLMSSKASNIPFMFSSLAPKSLNLCCAFATKSFCMPPKRNVPGTVPSFKSPDNNTSFNSFINSDLFFVSTLLKAVLICGNIASICLSTLRCICCAMLASAALSPICALSRSKNFCGFAPLGLNLESILSIAPLLSSS